MPGHRLNSPTGEFVLYQSPLRWSLARPVNWLSWLLVLVLALGAILPLPVGRAIGAGLGALIRISNRKRRDIVALNLQWCFPHLDAPARELLLRAHFRVSGQAYYDIGLLAFTPRWRLRRLVRFRDLERYREQTARGAPVILLVPHTVGMNLTGSLLAAEHPLFGLIKPVANPVMDWLLHRGRTRFGCMLFRREQGLRPVVKAIESGVTFYYLPDEDHGPRHSVFVPFFGVPAATLTTLGRMAGLTHAAVVPCFTVLTRSGYEIRFESALTNFPSEDATADAARMNQVLEDGIRATPEQYTWTFKLFKTRPDNAPSPYER